MISSRLFRLWSPYQPNNILSILSAKELRNLPDFLDLANQRELKIQQLATEICNTWNHHLTLVGY